MIRLKDIDNAVKKAQEVLHGRAKGDVKKSTSYNGRMQYAEVTFFYKKKPHIATFYRFKGNKNWLFSDMTSKGLVVA